MVVKGYSSIWLDFIIVLTQTLSVSKPGTVREAYMQPTSIQPVSTGKIQILHGYIKHAQSIFDIMAGAFLLVQPYNPAAFENDKGIRTPDKELVRAIKRLKEDMERFLDAVALERFKASLHTWCDTLSEQSVVASCYRMLILIDIEFAGFTIDPLPGGHARFSSLTVFMQECVIIPRLPDPLMSTFVPSNKKLREKRAEESKLTLGGLLKNFLISKTNLEYTFVINIPYNARVLAKAIRSRNEIRVALFPITNISRDMLFEFVLDDNSGTFNIISLRSGFEDIIYQSMVNSINQCIGKDIDFLVFPELFATTSIVERISGYLANQRPEELPSFIWLGSSWNDHINKCTVLDCYGKTLFEQHKHEPFTYKIDGKVYKESLSLTNREINLIDIAEVARIVTGICKDIVSGRRNAFINEYLPDFYVLPAYSGSIELDRDAKKAALEQILVFCCNSCSALEEDKADKRVSFVAVPSKKGTGNDFWLEYFEPEERCGDCVNTCRGFVFQIDFGSYEKIAEDWYSPKIKSSESNRTINHSGGARPSAT